MQKNVKGKVDNVKKILILTLALLMILPLAACEGGSSGGKAYVFSYNGEDLKIDDKAQDVLDAIGTPLQSQELGTCGIGDKDKLFVYRDFRVETYQMKGVDYFYRISLLTDQVSTKEGVSIGDGEKAVLDAYGEPDRRDTTVFTYEAKGMNLLIHFDSNSTVKSIVYMRAE